MKPLQAGVRLTAIIDACHSGSMLDLPYLYSTKGVLKEPNLAKEAAEGVFDAVKAYSRGDVMGAATGLFGLAKSAMGGGAHDKAKETRTSPADVIMWSGSKDSQTSWVPPLFPLPRFVWPWVFKQPETGALLHLMLAFSRGVGGC